MEMPTAVQTPHVKQGAVIGGWLCFALGMVIMWFSLWLIFIYGPLLVVAFILAIAAMAQRRIVGGLVLLLCCLIVAPFTWVSLSTRALGNASKYLAEQSSQLIPSTTPHEAPPRQPPRGIDIPAGFANARAEEIVVGAVVTVDQDGWTPSLSFSSDGRQFVYGPRTLIGDSNKGYSIALTIKDLHTMNTVKRLEVGSHLKSELRGWDPPVENTAWSSDGKRIVFVNDRYIAIVEIDSGKVIELPVAYPGPHARGDIIDWSTPTKINFGGRVLDLDTLTSSSNDDAGNQFISTRPSHHNIYLRQIGSTLWVENLNHSFSRSLCRVDDLTQRQHVVSADTSHIAVQRSTSIVMYYLSTRQIPQLNFRLVCVEANALNAKERSSLADFLRKQRVVWGEVYAPAINPLNGKVIGPDRNAYKGTVRILDMKEDYLFVRTLREEQIVNKGDVVAEFQSARWSPGTQITWNPYDVRSSVWGILVHAEPADSQAISDQASPPREIGITGGTALNENNVIQEQSKRVIKADYGRTEITLAAREVVTVEFPQTRFSVSYTVMGPTYRTFKIKLPGFADDSAVTVAPGARLQLGNEWNGCTVEEIISVDNEPLTVRIELTRPSP